MTSRRWSIVLMLLIALTAACGSGAQRVPGDDVSLSSFVQRVPRGPDALPFAHYFSFERYREGTDLPDDLSEEALIDRVFTDERAAYASLANPYLERLKLRAGQPDIVALAPLRATYTNLDGGGSVLVGEYDPDAIGAALRDLSSVVIETSSPWAVSHRLPDDAEVLGAEDPMANRFYAGSGFLVANDGSEVRFSTDPASVPASGVVTAASLDGVAEVAGVLDEERVYAATLLLDGTGTSTADDAVLAQAWLRAGIGTAVDGGDVTAVVVLWHADEGAARANAGQMVALLEASTDCAERPAVQQRGRLTTASCPTAEARFVTRNVARIPTVPLLR